MKLVYIASRITASGGVSRILSQKLSALVAENGYEVIVVSTNDETEIPFYEFHPQIRFHYIGGSFKSVTDVLRLYSILRGIVDHERPNWVMVTDNGFKAYFTPWFLKKHKVVFEIHGSKRFLFSSDYKKLKNRTRLAIVDFLAKRFYSIVLLNEAMCVEWKHKNIKVIPNYVERSKDVTSIPNSKRIIAVGRVVAEKGYVRMMDIFRKIHEKHPEWSLHVFGTLKDEVFYNSLLSRENEGVFFHGESRSVFSEIEKADFLIHTSFHEGFSLVIAEALSLGRPVVAFDVPFVINSLVKDQETGFLIEDGDLYEFEKRMLDLIEQPELLVEMGAKSSNSLKVLEKTVVLKQWKSFFES